MGLLLRVVLLSERASEIGSDCVDDDDDHDDDVLEIDTPLNHIYTHTNTHIYLR